MKKIKMKDISRIVKRYTDNLKKQRDVVSVVQIGSSLKKEKLYPNSDIDFLVIYRNTKKEFMTNDEIEGIEIQVINRGQKEFRELARSGNPLELIALYFGKILYDKGFFSSIKNEDYKPNNKTIERWIHTAAFNLGDAATQYSFPTCLCCYFKALHHAAREFCRAVIVKELGIIVEGDSVILDKLKKLHTDIYKNYMKIIQGRRNYEELEPKFVKEIRIKNSGLGTCLLAVEKIMIKSLKIIEKIDVPKVNDLISDLEKKHVIDHYHGFYFVPEKNELILNLFLKNGKPGFFTFDLEKGQWKKD